MKKEPSQAKYRELCARAEGWMTCACNELCRGVPRYKGGEPKDLTLSSFGVHFCRKVFNREWKSALDVLNEIEIHARRNYEKS
jgi:hypothetical protein